jgi:hypothetical protein
VLACLALSNWVRQKPIRFFPDHRVTLATQLFQPWPVQHRNMSAVVVNDPEPLHFPSRFGDALTTHAEHGVIGLRFQLRRPSAIQSMVSV